MKYGLRDEMSKRLLMAEQWNEFSRNILPKNCSEIQRKEMKRAFYAGAQSILFRIIAAFATETEPTDADIQIMLIYIFQELQDFAKLVKEGRA